MVLCDFCRVGRVGGATIENLVNETLNADQRMVDFCNPGPVAVIFFGT